MGRQHTVKWSKAPFPSASARAEMPMSPIWFEFRLSSWQEANAPLMSAAASNSICTEWSACPLKSNLPEPLKMLCTVRLKGAVSRDFMHARRAVKQGENRQRSRRVLSNKLHDSLQQLVRQP